MKRCTVLFLVIWLICLTLVVQAGPQAEYEEAYKIYISASASLAAYHNRMGELATRYLEQDGWKIDHYIQPQSRPGARFLIAVKEVEPGVPLYLVAIVGTESSKDVKIDLKKDKVYFVGRNPEEMAANVTKNALPDTEPKVHRGFNEFVQAGPTAVLSSSGKPPPSLPEMLRVNPRARVYLAGHSLGGAAATIAGARLLDLGLASAQIEVITFGAPPVGNAAFAEKFGPLLKLTRVVVAGDSVVTVLQGLVGGYRQFGKEVKFKLPENFDDPHKPAIYMDAVIKNYYDKRRVAAEAGALPPERTAENGQQKGRVYIAPLQNKLPEALSNEFIYMQEALQYEYRSSFFKSIQGSADASGQWLKKAKTAECHWLIVPEVGAMRVRQEKSVYYIIVHQSVYDVNTGAVLDMAEFSTGTYNLTPLEGFIHAVKGIDANRNVWMGRP